MDRSSIVLIGAGAAGSSMAIALGRAGFDITAIASRSLASAERCAELTGCTHADTDLEVASQLGEVVIIATPDGAIASTCRQIADSGGFRPGQLVLHLSGALGSDALHPARQAGADTLSMHPVQTLAEPIKGAELLTGAWFCLEGSDNAVTRGKAIAESISGRSIVIESSKKALYHAALCVASNYLVTLEAMAEQMLTRAGIPEENAHELLMPLIRGGVENLARSGLPDALTGPISRGDAETVRKHLLVLKEGPPETAALYAELGLETLKLAREKGRVKPERAEALTALLEEQLAQGLLTPIR
ncbi:MAG: Rossmann-like and DUF2520 domain-containing protein [Sedimenticola sp.]